MKKKRNPYAKSLEHRSLRQKVIPPKEPYEDRKLLKHKNSWQEDLDEE